MKTARKEFKKLQLDQSFYKEHKEGQVKSDFGLDKSSELIGSGMGLYSTVNLKSSIGPVKTEFYRIAMILSGTVTIDLGLETFHPVRNSIVFGFPGQVFSLHDQGKDFFAYYLLFREEFAAESPLLKHIREQFPFMGYSGLQSFSLSQEEAKEIEDFIFKIDKEIKNRKADISHVIQLYIQLILIVANRSYERQHLSKQATAVTNNALFSRFVKLVSQHFLKLKKVSDYSGLLHVTPDHLNRIIKSQSKKTAHELIDEMIMIEAKAYLLHTELTIAEIAYRLEFSDPSHFNKFFKKQANCTPLQYREKSK